MQVATNFEELLQLADLKITTPRKKVLDVLDVYREPISADVIKQKTALDKATVYRVLSAFTQANIIREINLRQGRALYELANRPEHHHIVCTKCGTIRSIQECVFDTLKHKVLRQSGFAQVTDHAMEFFGICKKCS